MTGKLKDLFKELENEIFNEWGTDPIYYVGSATQLEDEFAKRDCRMLVIIQNIKKELEK